MSTAMDPSTFLMGGGGRSAKFATTGDKIDGEITATEVTQQTDFETGLPKEWPDGNPMMQLVITLQTDDREDDQDDGVRRIFAKGSASKPSTSLGAVRAAVHAAGGKSLEVGGRLQMAYTGDGVITKVGFKAPKEFKAKYDPPKAASVDVDAIFGAD